LEVEQVLSLIHLEKCAHDVGLSTMFRAASATQFTVQARRTGETTLRNQFARFFLKVAKLLVNF
jgi:hypothetical protein